MQDPLQNLFFKPMPTRTAQIFLLALFTQLVFACSKQADTNHTAQTNKPDTLTTSAAETETQANPESSESTSIQYIKWSADINIPDPVSISMDNRGRAYVTQTQRRKAQDLDIRSNRDWIPDDVGLNSVEDKRSFFKTQLSPESSSLNTERVADHNGDGSHDWRDLTVIPERIHLVEDTDKDGFADSSKVYYDDFKTEVTGIAAGVLWHDGDVYATVAPDVWKFRDTDGDDLPDNKELVAHGFGLHIAYGGHDMHGLIMGPDGKVYWSIGDKGINVLSKEGKRFFYPNQGGMLRANPDGSDFEVFAHGLRNVQEPAFDAYGNWFGVDNDSDQTGEKERFMYIVNGMDAGWRNDYQYRGDRYNPWMDEGMTIPRHEGQAAYIIPTIQNYIDGPAGFVFNPGTALNEHYKDYFFLNGTLQGAQYAFQVEQDGTSFKMVNDHSLGEGLPLVGLTWGPDGALYTVDWGGGYPLNQSGAIWKLDTPGANESMRAEVQTLLLHGMQERNSSQLRKLLAHADQRLRLQAQWEIVNRGETNHLIEDSNDSYQLKRIHAIWGLGQLARAGDKAAINHLLSLLNDEDPEIQVQSSKVLADLKPGSFDPTPLISHLSSIHPRTRFQAGLSIGRQKVKEAFTAVVDFIASNDIEDSYLRHAGVMALVGTGGANTLSKHDSEAVRLSAVVALRRAQDPSIVQFLSDESEIVVLEAARAIHDDYSITEALPALAKQLVFTDSENEALIRRLINANFRIGGSNEAYLVAEYAANPNHRMAMRLEALDALSLWSAPPLLDRVDGRRRYLEDRPIDKIAASIGSMLEGLLTSEDSELLQKTVEAANSLSVMLSPPALEKLLQNRQAPSSLRVSALKSLKNPKTVNYALSSNDEGLRMAAAEFLSKTNKTTATSYLIERLDRASSVSEQQTSIALLSTLETSEADQQIRTLAQDLSNGNSLPQLQLDIIEAATSRGFNEELSGFETNRPTGSTTAAFMETLEGGNAEAGRAVTQTHLAAQCARCHKFESGGGSNIGPNLRNIGSKRDREYLLRSLVDPGADIAEGFGVTTVTLKSGETISAQLGQETSEGIELISSEGEKQFIKADTIASKTEPVSTMPPMGYLLTKRELRDVVEYLSSLK